MTTKRLILTTAAVMTIGGYFAVQSLSNGVQADDLQSAVDARRALMKEMTAQMKAMYGVVDARSGDLNDMAQRAQVVKSDAAKLPTLFPPGTSISDMPDKTHAKPEIWQNVGSFKSAAANLGDQAGKLVDAAKSGDMTVFASQFEVTGKACGNCHTDFRTKLQ